jgi:hypothetical protein
MRLDITPDPGFFSAFPHLNYKAWYALAEFVDNSIQSYERDKDVLRQLHGDSFRLKIEIDTRDADQISIRDNAGGIVLEDFPRAFRVAAPPPNRTGLSEFGMGMKTAACWFSPFWTVRSTAIGDDKERTVTFDIPKIVAESVTDLDVAEHPSKANSHYTEVILSKPYHPPIGMTKAKIKRHLTSIYRKFLERDEVTIIFDGEELSHRYPPLLSAPYYKDPDSRINKALRAWNC